jgi:sarcosine/dimethylglycine N-methyltransferase
VTNLSEKNRDLHYGNDRVDRLYARVWGDSIHFGIYENAALDHEAAVYETKRRMADVVDLRPNQHVLEVASGWGATARYLARARGARITATNIEEDHSKAGALLTNMAGLNARITHHFADYHHFDFKDKQFDVWWCQEATVHAADKRQVFAEACRVLKPGGRMVFSDQTTVREKCTDEDCARLAQRHGSDDLYSAEDFMSAMRDGGLIDVVSEDWSAHMGRHFANLVARIEATYDILKADIPTETIDFNHALWSFGRDMTAAGVIGWHCFTGKRP